MKLSLFMDFFLFHLLFLQPFFNIWDFNERYIVKGEMDRILTRPIHSLFQIILERMELESLFGGITGIAVMVYAGSRLDLAFPWYDPILFLFICFWWSTCLCRNFHHLASISFWSDARTSIMPMMYNIGNYGRYPVDIYNKVIRFVLTWILTFCICRSLSSCLFLRKMKNGMDMLF